MEPGGRRRWGIDAPRGVALTGQVPPVYSEERPPCTVRFQGDVLPPEMPPETSLCHTAETPMAVTEMPHEVSTTAEVPQEMLSAPAELPTEALPAVPSAVPPVEAGKDPCEGELPPCPEKIEIRPCEVRCLEVLVQPKKTVPRGSCLIHNWQEEPVPLRLLEGLLSVTCLPQRATNHLDFVPDQEEGSEGFIFRHGHRGLLVPHSPPWPTTPISTMKDHYRPPHSVLMLGQGQREAMMQSVLYQKYRKEMTEETCPSQVPKESASTRHQDHPTEDCQLTSLPPTQPHKYYTEQPLSFWLEHARRLPSVSSIRSGDSPFRRNASFSTPITESLEQPLSCAPRSSRFWPHK